MRPARSVRVRGEPPRIVATSADELAAAAGIAFGDGRRDVALGERLTLLPAVATKGLEFDAVVVVEPSRIVTEDRSGLRLLYIVLTRAVRRLTILHHEPLPEPLLHRSGEPDMSN